MHLSTEHRRFLIQEQAIGGGIFNTVLNAGIAWAVFPQAATIPLWGDPGVAPDTIVTSFVLPFLVCLIATPLVRRAMAHGKVAPLGQGPEAHPLLRWLPGNVWARAAVIGLLSAVVAAPAAIAMLKLFGVEAMARIPFVLFKALFAGAVAATVTPVIALYALATPATGDAKQAA